MNKKLKIIFIVAACLIGTVYSYSSQIPSGFSDDESCAFCDEDVLNRQKFYEDDLVLALYTHKPILQGHCLIIPKRHVERFEMLTDEEITQIGRVIKKVNLAASEVFKTSFYLLHK